MRKNNTLFKHYLESNNLDDKITELKKEESPTVILPHENKNQTQSNVLAPVEGIEVDEDIKHSLLESEEASMEAYITNLIQTNLTPYEVISNFKETIKNANNFPLVISSLLEKYNNTQPFTNPKIEEIGDIVFLSMFRNHEEISNTLNSILSTHESISLNIKKHNINSNEDINDTLKSLPLETLLGFNGFSEIRLTGSEDKTRFCFDIKVLPEHASHYLIDSDGCIFYNKSGGFNSDDLMENMSTLSSFLTTDGDKIIARIEYIVNNYIDSLSKYRNENKFALVQLVKLVNECLVILLNTFNHFNSFVPEIIKILCSGDGINTDPEEYLIQLQK